MGKLVVTEYVTLDGYMDEPGKWSFPFWNEEAAQFKFGELMASDAQLLGRRTYEGFAAAWPTMTDTGEFGERMNGMPKYVVSTTLDKAEWNNSTIIRDDVPNAVSRLKEQYDRDILVAGSGVLLETLRQHDLVDEYRFMIHPIILGHGEKPLFRQGNEATLQLVDSKTTGKGVVILTYRPA
ncbi:MAG TPA: dihydrofolate reductase family protein [Thermomicrobiales bacterium]|nr:dihydrofolate reductase family protein [Thermomicrobiales bacterium]